MDRLLASFAEERALAALLDGLQFDIHTFDLLTALVDRGLGGGLGLLDVPLNGDSLSVFLHHFFGVDHTDTGDSGVQGDRGENKG